jgi:hypothetical protein
MESGKKRKGNKRCRYQGPGQERPCEKSQQYKFFNNSHYCQKHYNQSLHHQQGTEQSRSTNPVNGHIIVSELSSIQQDELHLNQATVQPCSEIPVNARTDIDGIIVNAYASILNEELVVAQATTQPCNATPIDTTKNNNASSRVPHDELLLDQATVQPRNENPVNVTTNNDGITIDASTTSILNEESIEEPHSSTPIDMTANGNVFNPTNRVCHKELIGAQPTIELESNASVEPTSPQHREAVENNATIQPSSTNQNHWEEPSNTISPQDGAAVENNDCDFDASCGILQWELDSTAATKQQIYSDKNRNAIPRNKAEVALLPARFEAIVRSAVKEVAEQVSLERAPLINELKCLIEMLESNYLN